MNYVDIVMIIILVLGAITGFKKGFIKSVVSLIGTILVIVLAFYLKNPLAALMYEKLPFFSFGGEYAGVSVLNILLYEAIAFLIVAGILGILLKVILVFTKLIDSLVNSLIILTLPSKILGMIIGVIESFVLIFIVLFIFTQVNFLTTEIKQSEYGDKILKETPFLSGYANNIFKSFDEIYKLKDKYNDSDDKEDFNKEAFDTLLKYEVISVESANKLVASGKLKIENAEEIVEKYEKKGK